MAAALLALPLAGCARPFARRAARGAVRQATPAVQQPAATPAQSASPAQGMSSADKAALDAELDAMTRDLKGVDVPSDGDFSGVDSGLR